MSNTSSVDTYIKSFPLQTQEKLSQIRKRVTSLIPEAQETIKYNMPTFTYKGKNLVYFAGYKNHIGFYPTPHTLGTMSEKLKPYLAGRGTTQFPLDAEIPMDIVDAIVLHWKEQIDKSI